LCYPIVGAKIASYFISSKHSPKNINEYDYLPDAQVQLRFSAKKKRV